MAVEIGAKFTVDTAQGAKSINDMQKAVKDASTELKSAKVGSEEYKTAQEKLKTAQENLTKSTKEQGSKFQELKGHLKDMVPGFSGAAEGASSLGTKLMALAANPIVLILVAIVAALKFLYEAFTYSVAGGKKMEQMWEGVKAAMSVVTDRVMALGQAIIKFFSGDFKGAINDAKKAVSGVGEAVEKAYSQVAKATEELQKLHKQEREASVLRAQQNAEIVKSKELLNDETASIQDRRAALKQVSDIERKIGEEDVQIAKKKYEQQKIIWGQTTEGLKKHAQELADMQIEIFNKEEETARHEIQLQRQNRTLNKQEAAKEKEEDDAAKAKSKEERQNLVEYRNKLLKLEQDNRLLSIKDSYQKEKQVLENNYADAKRALDVSLQDRKITLAQYNKLLLETLKGVQGEQAALKEKHDTEVKKKEEEFQKELSAINLRIRLAGILDVREKERVTLEQTFKEKREQVIANEKLDSVQKNQEITALRNEEHLLEAQLQKKFDDEDLKKRFDKRMAAQKLIMNDTKASLDQKRMAILTEQGLIEEGLRNKVLSEQDYNTKVAELSAARQQIDDIERQSKIKGIQAISQAMQGFAALLGQQTAAGKVLAIAEATINTFLGASQALKDKTIPTFAKPFAVAGIIAQGLATVKQIVSVQVPGASGGSAPTAQGATAPAPIIPQNSATTINQDQVNQIGNGASRAFVVETDVTNNQERITRLNRAARLGG